MKTKDSDTEVLSPCQIIAWNLERARRSRGLTQDQAAEKLEPYLGYRLSRAAFCQAERCLYGKLRRFDADEIVAFARAFELPIADFFRPPQPHFQGKTVMVNGRPGNPKAHVTSPPLTRPQLLMLAQGLPGGRIKTVRRGRRPWVARDLAQVEAAAQGGQNMEQIARSLGIHPATLFRKMQNSPEFNEAIEIGRKKRAVATTIALYETEVPVSPRDFDHRSAILFHLRTHPVWRHRNDTTVKTGVDTPPGGRYPGVAEELKLIQAMTAQERHEIEAICERARQRLSHPEVKATTQPVGQDRAMERLKTPIPGAYSNPTATPANNPKVPENTPESLRANADATARYKAMLHKLSLLRDMGRAGQAAPEQASQPVYEPCPKCGRRPTLSEEPTLNNGIPDWHQNCPGVPGGPGSVWR